MPSELRAGGVLALLLLRAALGVQRCGGGGRGQFPAGLF